MKRILLFLALAIFTIINTNAQNEFTGEGDGYSWDDPFNWISGEVPFDGEDILIEGFSVEFFGSIDTYGSLDLRSGANILIYGEMNLYSDLYVDATSTISVNVLDLNDFGKVVLGGNYYYNGDVDILFSAYVPQIGNSYQIIQGLFGSCGIATTDIVPENQSGGGYETTLAVQCQSDDILFTVTGINYTTAISWDGEGGDNMWSTASNWDPNGIPTATDRVIINLPTGATVATDGAGTTSADRIIIGDNNQLIINGNLDMYSFVGVNATGSLNWKAGSLSRTDTNVQSFILNRGFLLVDGPGNKTIENGFEITSQGENSSMVVAEKGFDINDGEVTIYRGNLIIDGDDITIGYTSGSQHSLRILNAESLIKTSGSGTSSVNLTDLQIGSFASVICEEGTLAFGENLTNYGSLSGGGSYQLPNSHVEAGKISPGTTLAQNRNAEREGVLAYSQNITNNAVGNFQFLNSYIQRSEFILDDTTIAQDRNSLSASRNEEIAGSLTFIGNLTTGTTSDLKVNIYGATAGTDYDQITVTNQAVLEGNITPILGYLPANDASFEVLKAANLSSCNYPSQVVGNFEGTDFTFDVICQNNTLYLNGPGAVLSTQDEVLNAFSVYPNPANSEIFIQSKELNNANWRLYNQLGQLIKKGEIVDVQTRVALESITSGLYFIEIENDKDTKIIKKIVVKD